MERTGKRQAKDGRRRRRGKKNSKTGPLQLKSCAWPNNTEQKEPFPVSSRWSITWRRGSLRKPLLPLFHTHTHKNHPSREISNVVGGCELEIQMSRALSLVLIFCFVLLCVISPFRSAPLGFSPFKKNTPNNLQSKNSNSKQTYSIIVIIIIIHLCNGYTALFISFPSCWGRRRRIKVSLGQFGVTLQTIRRCQTHT